MPRVLVFFVLAWPIAAAYALYATGIVVIYQASRVLNLAHGAMAAFPALLMYTMVHSWHVPMPLALVLAIAAGALIGVVIDAVFIRRLRVSGPTAQTVGTVAALGLLIALAAKLWGTSGLTAPRVFPAGHINIGDSQLRYGQLGLVAVAIAVTFALTALLRATWWGLALRGAAENRNAAALVGLDPERTTAMAWALGGALAALAGILLAAVTSLNPYTLALSVLPAFVAALIGGLASLPAALVGSAVVGLVIGFVPLLGDLPVLRTIIGQVGGAELMLAVTAMVVMALRGHRFATATTSGIEGGRHSVGDTDDADASSAKRRVPIFVWIGLLAAWAVLPGVPFSVRGDVNDALVLTLVGISLVILTGWVGQISLAQAAFVGVGAYSTTYAVLHTGLAFPFTLIVAGAVGAGVAAALGVVALRVRGLYLAVATLIFGWMADSYLFSAPWFSGAGGSITIHVTPIGVKGGYPYFDFGSRRTFYVVALAIVGVAVFVANNLRRSKTGRAFAAVRGSETAAASFGIDVTHYKLLAFALSGGIAGIAGNLIVTHQQTIGPAQFASPRSLFFLAVAVVGGVQSIGGVAASATVFAFLSELFFRVSALHGWLDVVSASLLAVVLLFDPGGLAALPLVARRAIARTSNRSSRVARVRNFVDDALSRGGWAQRQLAGLTREFVAALRSLLPHRGDGSADTHHEHLRGHVPLVARGDVVLDARDITVRFGGVTACERASLSVGAGEIVGLIGPNGAGKTTLFNAIAGLVAPTDGTVSLNGDDVTAMSVHERARSGLGRTFQQVQVLPELTVRDNLLVATHGHDPTGFASHMVVTRRSAQAERAARNRVDEIVPLLGLEDVADRRAGALPFGTLRLIELARAIVGGAPVVMLDEPASGLDTAETARFASLLRDLRDRFDLSLLVIEHDIAFVVALCDTVFVLDQGRVIAQGTPAEVQADPAVMAAYLGEPTRSVEVEGDVRRAQPVHKGVGHLDDVGTVDPAQAPHPTH